MYRRLVGRLKYTYIQLKKIRLNQDFPSVVKYDRNAPDIDFAGHLISGICSTYIVTNNFLRKYIFTFFTTPFIVLLCNEHMQKTTAHLPLK